MTVFNLTTASPESPEIDYIEGVVQALVDGAATFGGASVLLSVSIGGSDFVEATITDFAITSPDSLRFQMNNSAKYKFVLNPVGAGADIDVYVEVDPNACGG